MMSTATDALFYVQCDWNDAIKEGNGKAWITFKKRGEKGHHSFLVQDDSIGFRTESRDFELGRVNDRFFEINHKNSDLSFKVVSPVQTFGNIHSKTLTCLDVSSGGLGISSEGNKIFVWETSTGAVRRCLEGHLGDVYTCQLFPSGIVVLSGGNDLRVKIWCAETGNCPRTLTGSRSPIVALSIIDAGKNFVTANKDGSILLWSASNSQIIEPTMTIEDCPTCCDITTFNRNQDSNMGDVDVPELEVGTEDKLLAVGGDNGLVALIQILDRDVVRQTKLETGVSCIKFMTPDKMLIGCEDGSVVGLGVADLKQLFKLHDSDSAVISLEILGNGFIAGRRDGSCVYYGDSTNRRVVLSGVDIDPVHSIAKTNSFVFTGSRDGKIRKYSIDDILH